VARILLRSPLVVKVKVNRAVVKPAFLTASREGESAPEAAQQTQVDHSIPSLTFGVLNAFNELRAACSRKRFLTARYRERLCNGCYGSRDWQSTERSATS